MQNVITSETHLLESDRGLSSIDQPGKVICRKGSAGNVIHREQTRYLIHMRRVQNVIHMEGQQGTNITTTAQVLGSIDSSVMDSISGSS